MSRRNEIDQIDSYIDSVKSKLNSLMGNLGWDSKQFENQGKKNCVCPLDPNHIMPESSLTKHIEYCSWRKDGYTKEEMEQALPSSHYFYKNSTSIIPVLIDEQTQNDILTEAAKNGRCAGLYSSIKKVPRTMDHCITELSTEERLAIYDYVVNRAKSLNKPCLKLEDLQLDFDQPKDDKDDQPKSHLEILAEQRDYKRRRQSYRAKNVHITKKTYTGVLRDVIESQMNYLTRCIEDDTEIKTERKSEERSDVNGSDHNRRKHKHRHHSRDSSSRRHSSNHKKSSKHSRHSSSHKKHQYEKHKKHKRSHSPHSEDNTADTSFK